MDHRADTENLALFYPKTKEAVWAFYQMLIDKTPKKESKFDGPY